MNIHSFTSLGQSGLMFNSMNYKLSILIIDTITSKNNFSFVVLFKATEGSQEGTYNLLKSCILKTHPSEIYKEEICLGREDRIWFLE